MTIAELLAELDSLDVRLDAESGRLRVSAPKGRLTPELQAQLAARKDELLEALQRGGARASDASATARLTAIRRNGVGLPLSFFQERLWVIDRLAPGETAYSIATLLRPTESMDLSAVHEAIRRVIARHEILRSRYVLEGNGPVVRIGEIDDVPIVTEDLRMMDATARETLLANAADTAAHKAYDLASEPPVRFKIYRIDDEHAALLVAAHHIAIDAWSFGVLFQDLQREYVAVREGRAPGPIPTIQYVDFAAWQRRAMEDAAVAERLQYWKSRLTGLPQLSTFPSDSPEPRRAAGQGATDEFILSPQLYAGVQALAREHHATPYMVLLAAMAVVLHRHTGQIDLGLGSPVGTRALAELENVIGPVVNPLVMRFRLDADPTFAQLIEQAREAVLDGHANQDVPFERIVQELNPERSLGHSPLFQVAVVLHNVPGGGVRLTDGGAIYDLTLFATERDSALSVSMEYRADLYDRATIARIFAHVERVLTDAVADAGRPVSALSLLDAEERARLIETFNDTGEAVDRMSVVAQFARTVAAHADDVAVVAGEETLTYRELAQRAAGVASQLRAAGVQAGDFVGLAVDRSSALPVAALGILQSGAAYVALDLEYPVDRVKFMLQDSAARHVVTTRAFAKTVDALGGGVRVIYAEDDGTSAVSAESGEPRPSDPAYLIYTSGSTGKPKGVVVPHSAVSNLLGTLRSTIGFSESDAIVSVTSPAFDISVLELFLPLVQAGRLVIASREAATDGAKLARLIDASGATMFQSTPSGWRLLMNAGWGGNDKLSAIAGGEPMTRELADWLLARVGTVWNGYGPTETTVYSTAARIERGERITIGRPLANTRIFILDANRVVVPIGAPGEICIAGDGVANGYHNRAELTAEKFVASVDGAGRMYRTGDIGRWLADGRIEHLGRADGQIKLRGYRIETGEIESALATHPAVRAAVVDVRGASTEDQRLVAWTQFHDDEDATTSELRRHLRQRLPEFMIPSLIVPVDVIPLTPNGKIDRRGLPDPFASQTAARGHAIPPTTPTERLIADIWSRLLGVSDIAVGDSFFELGGHSLLAMRAAVEIASATKVSLDPRLLFFRTLGQIAEACDANRAGEMEERG